jgi:hypothetical protein
MATITITVTVAGGKFLLDGVSQATYSATPGNTYKFDQADASNGAGGGHPLRLATAADAAGSTEYTTGVTTNGSPGSAGAYTQIVVTATTVQALHYYCSNHTGMGGLFNVGGTGTVQYQEREGFAVQNKSTDPTPYAQALTDNPYGGSWTTLANMQSSTGGVSGSGTTTATVAAGGYPANDRAETWNGSSWTEVNEINTARGNAGATGTGSTASILFGGRTAPGALSALNESWNGSSWTEVGDLNTASRQMAYFGTQTAAIKADGIPYPTNSVESWNGSAWTEVNENNTARQSLAGSTGSPNSNGIIFAGYTTTYVANAETWNGSSWTETGDLNTARGELGGAGSSSTNAIGYAGETSPGAMTQTESWDGSSWSEVSEVNTARYQVGYSGSSNASALLFGGLTPSATNATEQWAFSGLPPSTPAANYSDAIIGDMYYNSTTGQFKAISEGGAPIGSWSSGGTMNTARAAMNSFGASKDSAIVGNGFPGPTGNKVEQYDGTTWTEIAEYNTSRAGSPFGGGTVAAGVVAGGQPMPPASGVVANTESWNGSAWSEVNDLPNARTYNFGTGTSTAALSVGNYGPGPQPGSPGTEVASWDGTNWTEVAETNDKRRAGQGQGSAGSPYTDFIASGGEIPPGYVGCETWNGTSWTEVANNNQQRYGGFGSGASSTSAIIYGGGAPGPGGGPRNAETEVWDGTSWTEIGDMATARVNIGGSNSGSGGNALAAGGETTTAYTGISEEWSAADFQIKTVTTS